MFSKSKRFLKEVPQAPPVGSYDMKDPSKKNGGSFLKSDRFVDPKDLQVSMDGSNRSDILNSTASCNNPPSFTVPSSAGKKKAKAKPIMRLQDDSCRKSLEADVEFQESKVAALLERIQSLEAQIAEVKAHSDDVDKNNDKLHDLLSQIRKEKMDLMQSNENLSSKLKEQFTEHEMYRSNMEAEMKNEEEQRNQICRNLQDKNEELNKEKGQLDAKLDLAHNLNMDVREQLEGVELVMTENLRALSIKYECLEQTLEYVQSDYKKKLERSNSQLSKTKEAYEACQKDLSTMHSTYDILKQDFEYLVTENEDFTKKISDQESQINNEKIKGCEYVSQIKELEGAQLRLNEEMMKKLAEMTQQLKEERDVWERKSREYDDHIACITDELESTKSSNAELLDQDKEKQAALDKVEEEKRLVDVEVLNLKTSLNKAMEAKLLLENESCRLKADLKNIEGDMKCKTEELSVFKEEHERYKKEQEEENKNIKEELGRRLIETQMKLTTAEATKESNISKDDLDSMMGELELWKKKYVDLETKVGPFMAQLDGFELEKQALLNENAFTQSEISKLSDKYAQLLGHQNTKQKIHHIRKLKEESLSLKQEVVKLRTKTAKDKQTIRSLEEQLHPREKRFDKSKAFAHEAAQDKENIRTPLKSNNIQAR